MDVYGMALKCARDKLASYEAAPLQKLTPQQIAAVRLMVADAYICGHDFAEAQRAPRNGRASNE